MATDVISRQDRHNSGDSAFAGLPLWSRVVAMVGIPGAIAFFLVWMGAQTLPQIQADMNAFRVGLERQHALYEQQVRSSEETFRLLQRICSNSAKTDEERQRCFDR
jgi:hypothetical protein